MTSWQISRWQMVVSPAGGARSAFWTVFSINLKSFAKDCDWSILISAEESNRSTWLWSAWRTQLTEFRRMAQYLFLPHKAVCDYAVQIQPRIIIIIIYFRPSRSFRSAKPRPLDHVSVVFMGALRSACRFYFSTSAKITMTNFRFIGERLLLCVWSFEKWSFSRRTETWSLWH